MQQQYSQSMKNTRHIRERNFLISTFFALVSLFGCSAENLPLDPNDPNANQPPLDTQIHLEPDQTWKSNFNARDIRWRFLSSTALNNSIETVGSFQITFANTNFDRDWQSNVAIRFRGNDGTLHIPSTPLTSMSIAADSTISIRENFILEIKDRQTANAITKMNIILF